MPKKLLQIIESMFKRSLWNGEVQNKGNLHKYCETIFFPKAVRGLNITDIYVWNEESILNHMWNRFMNKEKLLIVLVHTFY